MIFFSQTWGPPPMTTPETGKFSAEAAGIPAF